MADRRPGGERSLPPYARMMADYHRAFYRELRAVVATLGIAQGSRVVDMACGDGSYALWLAEQVTPGGEVLAVDLSSAFLDQARKTLRERSARSRIRLVRMDLEHSPLADGIADLVWCAQSLYSLENPVESIRRMSRAVRPSGRVAVFESDELHHVTLSWPIDLELALRSAELRSFVDRSNDPRKFYVARELPRIFREAGLSCTEVRSFAFTRKAPFDPPTRGFLKGYLADVRRRASPFLDAELRTRFDELADPESPWFLLDDPDALVVSVACLAVAETPGQ